MIGKLQTRIKVVTIGEDVKYIPQKKGIRKIDNTYKILLFFLCLILLPFTILIFLSEILLWDEIEDYSLYITEVENVDKYTIEYSKKTIDYFLDEQQRLSQPKPKKVVTYLKYP